MKKYIFITVISVFCFAYNALAQTGLQTGTKAPLFVAKDNTGKTVNLKAMLNNYNDVVIIFYRGQWCPYCNKYIKQLQDSLQQLSAKKAYVIAVTPETNEAIAKTVEKTHASFSLIHDDGYRIMKAYQVDYIVDDVLLNKYKNFGIDLEKNNGNKDHVLPVPATYIIDHTGKIKFVHFNKDYTKRTPVSAILANL